MFKFKSISLRGSWNLNVINDECPICRNNVLDQCSDCNNDKTLECISVMGECSHVYHLHCINKWLKKNHSCPLDNSRWEFKRPSQYCEMSNYRIDPSGNIINNDSIHNNFINNINIINTIDIINNNNNNNNNNIINIMNNNF